MDIVKKLAKSVGGLPRLNSESGQLYAVYGIFAASILYIFYNGQLATIGLAIGVGLILYVATNKNLQVALIGGALAGLIAVHYSRPREGFTSDRKTLEEFEEEKENKKKEGFEEPAAEMPEGEGEGFEEEGKEEEGFAASDEGKPRPLRRNGAAKKKAPNNGERAEFFELGKKYKGPSEEDDADFHLDAGTTFMNAYKSLKPEQIASMTKDTQELMQTQRQLMSTLSTLKPLIQDGKQMMDMFQSYFGNGTASMN
jgi:hypothetical protein